MIFRYKLNIYIYIIHNEDRDLGKDRIRGNYRGSGSELPIQKRIGAHH